MLKEVPASPQEAYKLVEAIAEAIGETVYSLCKQAGVCWRTVHDWPKRKRSYAMDVLRRSRLMPESIMPGAGSAMPIRPENKARYPKDWPEISKRIRFERAQNKCEWCGAENYKPHPITGSRVVLTVAHVNHMVEDCRDENLAALCQRCHNRHDASMRREGIRQRRRAVAQKSPCEGK